jgi:hypothetical protein
MNTFLFVIRNPLRRFNWWFTHGRPALFSRCRTCRAWVSWVNAHGCTGGESCEYYGLCSACISDVQEADLLRRIRANPPEALLFSEWPALGTEDPAEIEILRQREIDDAWTEALAEEITMLHAEAAPLCDCCQTPMRVVRDDDVSPPGGFLWGLYVPACECWWCPCDSGQDIPQPEGTACKFCGHSQGSCDCVLCACGWRHPRGFVCERPPLAKEICF